jgi:hypothetical protein
MLGKGWTRKAFGQRIGYILQFCAFQQFDVAIAYELTQIMHSSVDMPSALPISRIFAHHNTRCIIFPYFCGADLSEIETPHKNSVRNSTRRRNCGKQRKRRK